MPRACNTRVPSCPSSWRLPHAVLEHSGQRPNCYSDGTPSDRVGSFGDRQPIVPPAHFHMTVCFALGMIAWVAWNVWAVTTFRRRGLAYFRQTRITRRLSDEELPLPGEPQHDQSWTSPASTVSLVRKGLPLWLRRQPEADLEALRRRALRPLWSVWLSTLLVWPIIGLCERWICR